MRVYEVSVTVDPSMHQAFEAYMRETHIPDVLQSGCFSSASFERSESGRYRTRYVCEAADLLDTYLTTHASRLREDFAKHFPEGVDVSREVWEVVKSFA